MSFQQLKLKRVARFAYGKSLVKDADANNEIPVYGSNGQFDYHSQTNVIPPAIVIGRKGSYGKLTWVDHDAFATDTTFFIDHRYTKSNLRWLYYVLSTLELDTGTEEAAVPGLSREKAYEKLLHYTEPSQQTRIADFLDHETTRIDELIAKEERLLKLLDEKRTALISHAVTKGLDPNAELKDSGIEWLGQIPKGWEVKKLGRACRLQGGYAFKSDSFGDEGVPVVRMNNIKRGRIDLEEIKRVPEDSCKPAFALKTGDLVWGMSGSIGETGSLGNFAWINEDDLPLQLNQRVGRFLADRRQMSLRFLGYFLQTSAFYDQILLWVTGTAQFNISSSQVQGVWTAFPPTNKQDEIVSYLDEHSARFDALKAKINKAIDLLREKRTALISAAVTGKITI